MSERMAELNISEEDSIIAKDLALKIGAMLGAVEKPVIISAIALALATAELLEFVDEHARNPLHEYMTGMTKKAVEFYSANREPEPNEETVPQEMTRH